MTSRRDSEIKEQIRDWWASAPMTYAETHGTTRYQLPDGSWEEVEIGSRRFFELADQTFYHWNEPLHDGDRKFARIFDYDDHAGQRVLEVGCGMGCMAMNWAMRGARISAVDLNPTSIAMSSKRFEVFDLDGDIRQADAEELPFEDSSFDHAYSWGVLHHTPGIRQAVAELYRVLRPGGTLGLMLYNRNSFLYRYLVQYQEGLVHMESAFLDPVGLGSRYGDGARQEGNPHTWPVTRREVRRDLCPMFENLKIRTLGTDVPSSIWHWAPGALGLFSTAMIKALARRWGWSLWITARKPPSARP